MSHGGANWKRPLQGEAKKAELLAACFLNSADFTQVIARAAADDPALLSVDWRGASAGDGAVAALADALRRNSWVQLVDLRDNVLVGTMRRPPPSLTVGYS